jgi:hypothetical protein
MTRAPLASAFVLAVLPACGDPMLPSDFAGPPAGAVSGVVAGAGQRDAERPRLSLEWLGVPALVGQPLSYQRSTRLQNDWDIGLGLPAETVKFDFVVAGRSVRIGVAKMVYFDDRIPDGRLDWSCRGDGCDRVRAVSAQFVLFVDTPPYCQSEGRPAVARLRAGYHYYAFEGSMLRELGADEAMSFTLTDRAPADSDPTADLRAFAAALERAWSIPGLDGC